MENGKCKAINVAIPNTTIEKMKAIVAVSKAIENVSKAIISTTVEVTIANNTISGAEAAINIDVDKI